jgi:hypothetical protein
VTIINDGDIEPTETVNLELSAPTGGAVLGTQSTAIINIIDDDQTEIHSFTLNLQTGWNLISFPLVNDSIWGSQLTDMGITNVVTYDNANSTYKSYLIGISPSSYDINLKTDISYRIYCDRTTSITIYGPLPGLRSVSIFYGWNSIGWSSMSSSTAKDVCAKVDGKQTIAKYNKTSSSYDTYLEGISPDKYNFGMVPGEGYEIYSDSPAVQTYTFNG